MEKEELIDLAEHIYREAFDANCYHSVIRQYEKNLSENFEEMSLSPAFYHTIYNALIVSTVMELSKIYDRNSDTVNIRTLFTACNENKNLFPSNRGSVEIEVEGEKYKQDIPYQHIVKQGEECFFKDEINSNRAVGELFGLHESPVIVDLTVEKYLDLYQKKYCSIKPKMDRLLTQRNKIYAHNDKIALEDIQTLINKNPLKQLEIQELIDYALEVSKFVIACLTGICKPDKPANMEDWFSTIQFAHLGRMYNKII